MSKTETEILQMVRRVFRDAQPEGARKMPGVTRTLTGNVREVETNQWGGKQLVLVTADGELIIGGIKDKPIPNPDQYVGKDIRIIDAWSKDGRKFWKYGKDSVIEMGQGQTPTKTSNGHGPKTETKVKGYDNDGARKGGAMHDATAIIVAAMEKADKPGDVAKWVNAGLGCVDEAHTHIDGVLSGDLKPPKAEAKPEQADVEVAEEDELPM